MRFVFGYDATPTMMRWGQTSSAERATAASGAASRGEPSRRAPRHLCPSHVTAPYRQGAGPQDRSRSIGEQSGGFRLPSHAVHAARPARHSQEEPVWSSASSSCSSTRFAISPAITNDATFSNHDLVPAAASSDCNFGEPDRRSSRAPTGPCPRADDTNVARQLGLHGDGRPGPGA